MSINIIETNLKFGALSTRKSTKRAILHHAEASKCTAEDIHRWHLQNGWSGAGYHFLVRKDGSIYRLRPENAVGSHAKGSNSDSIGICFEGSYMTETMPQAQINAGRELLGYLKGKYGFSKVQAHRDVCSTNCPGTNFPFDQIAGVAASAQTPTPAPKKEPIDGELKSGGVTQNSTGHLGEISYQAHMREIGWASWQCDGAMVGTTGQNRRIEAFRLIPVGETDVVVHIKDVGDKEYKNISKDTILGTTGQNKRIEAIKITGKDTPYIYRVHQKNIGWTDWTFNGNWAGTKGKGLQIEAIEIMTAKFLVNPHVQNRGWLGERACENISGITGHNLRLEAFKINPLGTEIKAKAHIQGIGWEDYGVIKKDTIIGTVGEGKRLECLCFEGDFEYRVHVQNSGWTDWTKADGVATMGTVGQALRIEAIQFR